MDVLEPTAGVLAQKSLYIGCRTHHTSCADHRNFLLRDDWLLQITKTYQLLTPEEATELMAQSAEDVISMRPVDLRLIYRTAFSAQFIDTRDGQVVSVESAPPDLRAFAEEVMRAPERMSAELEVALDECIVLADIPPATLPANHHSGAEIRCQDCGKDRNLWINLSDGYIGCGRRQYGLEDSGCEGGKEGAAIRHWQSSLSQDLGLKLGSLTESSCEIFSYNRDVFVTLAREKVDHALIRFGLSASGKSGPREMTVEELALGANKALNLQGSSDKFTDRLAEAGVGVVNIGNSCYISSVLHCLKLIYAAAGPDAREEAPIIPKNVSQAVRSFCRSLLRHTPDREFDAAYHRKFLELVEALRERAMTTAQLSAPQLDPRDVFAEHDATYHYRAPSPIILKRLVGAAHHDFNNKQQQDVEEYLQIICSQFEKDGDSFLRERIEARGEEKIYVSGNMVRIQPFATPVVDLNLPIFTGADRAPAVCEMSELFADYRKSNKGLTHFPKFLFVVFRRQIRDPETLVAVKNPVAITVQGGLGQVYDFANGPYSLKAPGLLESETMYEDVVPQFLLDEVAALGFSGEQCEAAVRALPSGRATTESVISYILDHPELPVADESAENVTMIMSMGYSKQLAEQALRAAHGDLENAVTQLLNGAINEPNNQNQAVENTADGKYQLRATIVHVGGNVNAGHYYAICHRDARWWKYNDECVREVTDESAVLAQAYMAMFERVAPA